MDASKIAQILNAGGVVIHPTETVYGLFCDATNPVAVLKVYRIKNRPIGKSFPLLVKDINMLMDYAIVTDKPKKIVKSAKVPTNFIFKAKNLSPLVTQKKTAAFRISKNAKIKKLFQHFDKPIVATSANLAGQKPISDPRIYKEVFGEKANLIDAVVFAGINRKTKGSKIIDMTKAKPVVVRK